MKIFDTYAGEKVEFKPLSKGEINMYVCGPTVYDVAHLGHGRSAVSFDAIRRYFVYSGYEVKYVSNYTDIDDKMIKRAGEEGISVEDLARKIIPEYVKDYAALGILVPDVLPKATEHVREIVAMVKRLEEGGYTYALDDGVYYDVTRFPRYGQLSKQNLEALHMGARVEVKEEKRNPHDFVLWKFKKEGEPFWSSPWGDGRPGWHIECSAMTWKHLGETFDIHGGGLDLTFPHHECEMAQSQGCFGENSFARYWLHNGFIQVDNEKMSKSLGNFFTLKDIFKKYDPRVVRLMFLQTHYRNPINFSQILLDQAKAALERLHDFVRNLKMIKTDGVASVADLIETARGAFVASMDDDFDTSGALGALFELVKIANKRNLTTADAVEILDFMKSLDRVLGIILVDEAEIDRDVETLIKEREAARKNKNFARSDEIRDGLLKRGIALEDTSKGTIWKRV